MTAVALVAALGGGLFALFAFVHFVTDWVFQSHSDAMQKHRNSVIRAKHCIIYTIPFIPLLWILGVSTPWVLVCAIVLFTSHFFEDTYIPVFLWAKHIRKHPDVVERDAEGFKDMFTQPLGVILAIVIDQIIHLTFLWVLVIVCLLGL